MNKFKPRKFSCYTEHQKKNDAWKEKQMCTL